MSMPPPPFQIQSAKPCLDNDDRQVILRVFDSGLISEGDEVVRFEADLANYLQMPGVVATSSGFAALHLSLKGVGVAAGDEVVLPCVSTCPAMRNAVWAAGATPVYADINRTDFNLSVESVRRAITSRTRAVIAPHHTGVVGDIPALIALGLPVIEDCAQALGGTWQGRPAGTMGAASVFAFYATKIMTTIDGGAVGSMDPAVLARVRDLRYYRNCSDDRMRYNYKMQNLGAALGCSQLKKLPCFLARRAEIARRFLVVFQAAGGNAAQSLHDRIDGAVFYKLALLVPPAVRTRLLAAARREGLPCSTEFWWLTALASDRYPNAVRLMAQIATVPVYPALREEEVDYAAALFGRVLADAGPLSMDPEK